MFQISYGGSSNEYFGKEVEKKEEEELTVVGWAEDLLFPSFIPCLGP